MPLIFLLLDSRENGCAFGAAKYVKDLRHALDRAQPGSRSAAGGVSILQRA